jgi:hypothetical protein
MNREVVQLLKMRDKVIDDISVATGKISAKGLRLDDLQLVNDVLGSLSNCYKLSINNYIPILEKSLRRIDEFHIDNERIDEDLAPSLRDCVKGIRGNFRDRNINFFPSHSNGPCHPQCIVISSGDWEFGDTKMRNDILSYWYRCFYKNRFTLIFSESWQSSSWSKWETMIDAYVSEQKIEFNGVFEDVEHTVIIIEYSNDMFHLRYHKNSI